MRLRSSIAVTLSRTPIGVKQGWRPPKPQAHGGRWVLWLPRGPPTRHAEFSRTGKLGICCFRHAAPVIPVRQGISDVAGPREPHSVGGLVPYPPGGPAQHRVLVPEHQQVSLRRQSLRHTRTARAATSRAIRQMILSGTRPANFRPEEEPRGGRRGPARGWPVSADVAGAAGGQRVADPQPHGRADRQGFPLAAGIRSWPERDANGSARPGPGRNVDQARPCRPCSAWQEDEIRTREG
jgi:hypothetical protein